MADQNLTPTWIYPVRDGDAKIIDLPAGAAAPEGYVFSPADVAAAREVRPASAPLRTSRKKARK